MAHVLATRTLVDTATKAIVHCTGRAGDATDLGANVVFDSSASKYALATLTLAAAPTANFCIGETITTGDSPALHCVVQNYVAGATTLQVYRVTSASDNTALGWAAATIPGTTKSLAGSVSGTSSTTTHGSTASAFVSRTCDVRRISFFVSGGHSVLVYFAGSSATQELYYLVGGGSWGPTGQITAASMGSAAGDTGSVLGDILATSYGSAAQDTETFQVEIGKSAGWGMPNLEANRSLGYGTHDAITGY